MVLRLLLKPFFFAFLLPPHGLIRHVPVDVDILFFPSYLCLSSLLPHRLFYFSFLFNEI